MKRIPVIGILLALGLLVAASSESLACRYNVRETGFVDLGIESYRLLSFVGPETATEEISQLESLAAEILAGSSISLEVISVDQDPDHPAMEHWQPVEGQGRPSAALVSPMGHSLWLGSLWDGAFSPAQVRENILGVVSSPVRSRIVEELASAFGVVLLIEGGNEAENSRARTAVLQAIGTVESELEYFPKPIKQGPTLIILTREELTAERLLLWSLHLGADDLGQPVVAVLYGRGRWIGPTMIGEEITLDLVSRILFVIGADCECGLSPKLIRGTGIPIQWNRRLQALVSQDLGFDPDNPLVRMEVSKILKVDTWMDSRSYPTEDYADQLQIPAVKDSSGAPRGRPVFKRVFYLTGGMAALVLCVGAFIWIRARGGNQ
ncbi:MAG TPA: hypothetical protein VMY18_14565 [Acidobacteriota bacterium]|nr:hypothetical protein [Acidobacteriota bacterium]